MRVIAKKRGIKKMRNFFLTVFLISSAGLFAVVLDLDNAKRLAIENSSSLQASKADYKSSVYASWGSFVDLFGTASGSYSWTKVDQGSVITGKEAENESYGVTLSQPIFVQGAKWLSYRISSNTQEMKRLAYQEQEFVTLATAETKYFALLLAQRELEIAQNDLKSSQESLQQTIIKKKTGSRSFVDVLSMESEVKSKEVALLTKQNAYLQSKNEFCDFLHIDEQELELKEIEMEDYQEIFAKVQKLDVNNLSSLVQRVVDFGEQRNLSLKSLQESKAIAQKGKLMAALSPLPTVSASYSYSKSKDYTTEYQKGSNTLSLSVSMPISFLPFSDNFFDYQEARYQLRKVEAENYTTQMQIKLQIKAAVYTFVSSAKQVAAAGYGVEAGEGMFKQSKARYDNGLLSTADYLDALNSYQSSQLNLVSAKNNFFTAKSDLKRLLVIENDDKLLELF